MDLLSRNVLGIGMRMFPPQKLIIRSGIHRGSYCIGQDRDNHHLGTLSNILQHFTYTMKPSYPLLLAYVALTCGMYPAGKDDIS